MIPKSQKEAAEKMTAAYIKKAQDGVKAPAEVVKDLRASAVHAKTDEARQVFEDAINTVEAMQ